MQQQKNNGYHLDATALYGLRQKRWRELFVGSGRTGFHARLRGNDDAVRPVYHYAVAGGFAVIAAFQIYIKMNTGEDGITKHILTLVGSCLFIIGATIVFPAFFGYRI